MSNRRFHEGDWQGIFAAVIIGILFLGFCWFQYVTADSPCEYSGANDRRCTGYFVR